MANAYHVHIVAADGNETTAADHLNNYVADADRGQLAWDPPLLHYKDKDTGETTYHGWKLSLRATEYNRLTASADEHGIKHETLATYDDDGTRIAPVEAPNMLSELNIELETDDDLP